VFEDLSNRKKGYTAWVRQNPVGQKLPAGKSEATLEGPAAWRDSHKSRASQSESSEAGSHLSPSGPSPCHQIRYRVCFPCLRLSMKNSSWPSIVTGVGGTSEREGKKELSFSEKRRTSEV
jgi:hypothetical protein